MNAQHTRGSAGPTLQALGISAEEEQLYRLLLAHRGANARDVARWIELPLGKTQRLLEAIEAKGLATHLPERPRRYIPSSPQFAVEALIAQRQSDLERARAAIPELQKQAAEPVGGVDEDRMVELITSPVVAGRIFEQLMQALQTESMAFQRAPVMFSDLGEAGKNESQVSNVAVERGVRMRTLSDEGFLAVPGVLNRLRLDAEAGEEARICPVLPFKMLVVDRRIALIPLNVEDPRSGPTLLVRASALLDALAALFESFWERATPIVFTPSGMLKDTRASVPSSVATDDLLTLLAAGLNDKTVADKMRVSSATLNRRIAEVMKQLGTRTRFQMGWRAALDAFPQGLAAPARKRPPPSR